MNDYDSDIRTLDDDGYSFSIDGTMSEIDPRDHVEPFDDEISANTPTSLKGKEVNKLSPRGVTDEIMTTSSGNSDAAVLSFRTMDYSKEESEEHRDESDSISNSLYDGSLVKSQKTGIDCAGQPEGVKLPDDVLASAIVRGALMADGAGTTSIQELSKSERDSIASDFTSGYPSLKQSDVVIKKTTNGESDTSHKNDETKFRSKFRSKFFIAIVLVLTMLVLVATITAVVCGTGNCGDSDDSASPPTPQLRAPPEPTSPTPAPSSVAPTPVFVLTATEALRDAVDAYLAGTSQAPPINDWDVSLITDFSELFSADRNPAAANFNANLNNWNTRSALSMRKMFLRAESFNGDVSSWTTSRVFDMRAMFRSAAAFNSPIGDWDTSNVEDMSSMFHSAISFDQSLSWDTGRVQSMHRMFMSATSFNGTLQFSTGSVTDMSDMFNFAVSFKGKGLESFDTSLVNNMGFMFYGASFLVGDELIAWNVQNVDDFSYMFAGARSFNQNLCSWQQQLVSSESIATLFMFQATSCPHRKDPEITGGPWCQQCKD